MNSEKGDSKKYNYKQVFVSTLIIFGYIFFIASLCLFASIIYSFIVDSDRQANLVRQLLQTYYEQAFDLFLIYIGVYSTLIILFISALICIFIGLRLVGLAQIVGRGTIPDGDFEIPVRRMCRRLGRRNWLQYSRPRSRQPRHRSGHNRLPDLPGRRMFG